MAHRASQTTANREELTRCRELLRDAGLRATASRIAVLALLRSESTALSHAEVADSLDEAAWDRATLYRNLIDLTEVGLLRRMELGDRTWRFEVARRPGEDDGDNDGEHPHFVCTACGTAQCLPELEFRSTARSSVPRSVRANEVAIQLRGLCDDCG